MPAVDLGGRGVLVVDDVRFTRMTLAKVLRDLTGGPVLEAEDGVAALDALAQAEAVACVITDVDMPRCDGLALLKAIRVGEAAAPRDLPVVFLTGHAEFDRLGPALRLDLSGFLAKPTSRQAVERCLVRLFGPGAEPHPAAAASIYQAVDLGPGAMEPAAVGIDANQPEHEVALVSAPAGSVLTRDLLFGNGRLLLPAGTRLTAGMLARLRDLAQVSGLAATVWVLG